jgi:DNA-binding transcriptional MerR regulator
VLVNWTGGEVYRVRAGEAAAAAGASVKALRYYESLGLLQPGRLANGYRAYTEEDVRLAVQVRAVMDLGLSASQTRPFLECLRAGYESAEVCPESLAAYRTQLDRLDTLIVELTDIR